jgi:hypothetical protein
MTRREQSEEYLFVPLWQRESALPG